MGRPALKRPTTVAFVPQEVAHARVESALARSQQAKQQLQEPEQDDPAPGFRRQHSVT